MDRLGNLTYVAADNQTAMTLARIQQRAAAVRAMQCDINTEWPTLITYVHTTASPRRRSHPNNTHSATRYRVPTTATSSPSTVGCPGR
jgi:hypothetical protein